MEPKTDTSGRNLINSTVESESACNDVNNGSPNRTSHRFDVIMCAAGLVTTFICITLTIVTDTRVDGQSEASKVSNVSWTMPEVCTDCFKLIKNPYNPNEYDPLMAKVTQRIDTGIWLCCASIFTELTAMFEMKLRQQETKPIHVKKLPLGKEFKFTPASAHKMLLPEPWEGPVPYIPDENHVILRMNPDYNEYTEHFNGINVTVDAMVIQYTGLYYVYSSVFHKPNTMKPAGEFGVHVWNHYVHLTRPNKPAHSGILLKTAHTACDSYVQTHDINFAGGLFHLEAGDVIQVCVSGHGLVEFNKESTFLGMFMLASGRQKD